MTVTRFEWDEDKNRLNQRKHGIGFETALRVFADPLCVTEQDRIEGSEMRWRTWGLVGETLLLLVAHTIGEDGGDDWCNEVIRIISARKATPRERRRYAQENR